MNFQFILCVSPRSIPIKWIWNEWTNSKANVENATQKIANPAYHYYSIPRVRFDRGTNKTNLIQRLNRYSKPQITTGNPRATITKVDNLRVKQGVIISTGRNSWWPTQVTTGNPRVTITKDDNLQLKKEEIITGKARGRELTRGGN